MPRNPVHSLTKASVERADGPSSIQVGISPERDYAALVELLAQLHQVPDSLGKTVLTKEEAEQIRALGFPATQGEWWVPVLPNNLVMGDGLLEPLSWTEDVDPRRLLPEQLEKSPAKTDEEKSVEPGDEVRILQALQRAGLWVNRRRLQKNLWRLGSRRFNGAMASLQARGVLELNGSMVHLAVTELDKELSANLQMPENAALFRPVATVSVHRKDRRHDRPSS